ncbi:hypothetical protein [Ancylobacter sp.]|uniref:hypothetical protein n=1 Tax=Ancylobacter sp. TaxID=1872567 RepID=UPI003D1336AB
MTGIDSIFKGSAYLIGATTGVALMVPVTAGALATGSMTRLTPQPVAIEAFGPAAASPGMVMQSQMVNRTAKGPRLNFAPRPQAASAAPVTTLPKTDLPKRAAPAAPSAVVDNGAVPAPLAPSRATRTPKGCLSAIGVTKSSLSTEELTVCVADASVLSRIN